MRIHSSWRTAGTLMMLFITGITMRAQTNLQGFFLDGWTPKSVAISAFDTVPQTTDSVTVNVMVDADSVLTRVSQYVYGHNAAGWSGKMEQSSLLVNNVKALAPHVIRWPGGNLSNEYFWNATSQLSCPKDLPPTHTYVDLQYGANASGWTMPVSSYYDFLAKTNSTGIICVNYSYARYGTSADPVYAAAKYAADWVRFDNGRTKYWEIGNENFGDWEAGYKIDTQYNKDGQPQIISGTLYGKHCRVFIDEMRKAAKEVGSDIKIGVVAMDGYVSYNTVMRDWNKGMMQEVADKADFLIVHSYYTPYAENSTISTILNSALNTKNYKQYVIDGLKSYANHEPLPVALTEWNIFAEGSGQGVSYINGMHATMVLGELIKNQYGQASRWDFLNGWNNGDNHGLFVDGDPGATRYNPRAPFFYMYYFQQFFGDKMVYNTVSGSSDVICYASSFSSGPEGIVLVNKGSKSQDVRLQMKNFKTGSHYYYYLLTGGTDNGNFSRKVYVNGITTSEEGGGPAQFTSLKPYGTDIHGDIVLSLPPLSVIYTVVENDTSLQKQTITFDSVAMKTFGDPDFSLHAVSSSGLPVQLSSTNPNVALVSNNMVHIVGAGTCSLVASQDGDTLWQPAMPVIRDLVVTKIPQIITMDTTFTGVYLAPGDTIEARASSGLPVVFVSSSSSIATVTNGVIHYTGTGTCDISAYQKGNANYLAAPKVVMKLTVLKADQEINFPLMAEKTVGDADFAAGASASSGLACSYTSSNPEVAMVSGNLLHIAGPGVTTITASQGGNNLFYPASDVSQDLTVNETSTVNDKTASHITLFPNPARDQIHLKNLPQPSTIILYNSTGSRLGTYETTSGEYTLPIDERMRNGIYFIRVNEERLGFVIER